MPPLTEEQEQTFLEQLQSEFDATPSYVDRYKPGQAVRLVALELRACGHWHAPEDECNEPSRQ